MVYERNLMKIKNILFLSLVLLINYNTIYPMAKEKKQQLCPQCNKSFISFKRHLLTHTNIRPYKCGICAYDFIDLANCRRHVMFCCHKNYIDSAEINKYTIINKVKLIYQCGVCNGKCSNSQDYYKHMNKYHPEHVYAPQYLFEIKTSNKPAPITPLPQQPILNLNNLTQLEPLFGNNQTLDLLTHNAFNSEYSVDNLKLLK